MNVIEDTLEVDLETFLARPLFCFLGTVAADGAPRVTPLWFHYEDGTLWIIANDEKTYPDRIRRDPRTTIAVVDFDRTTGRVEHVGMRGRATVEPHDPERAVELLEGYLGPDRETWDTEFFGDRFEWGDEMIMVRFEPSTVVARDQSYVAPLAPDPG